jgi:predicted kinase
MSDVSSRTPRLILLNGPPGIGKSTLAQRYVDDHPLVLNLDIDTIRTWLGRWEENDASKYVARDLAWATARAHLVAGHDVVVPQLLLRDEVIERVRTLAHDAGADFVEIVLLGDEAENLERFRRRRDELTARGAKHPALQLEPGRVDEAIAFSHRRLRARTSEDPPVRVVEIHEGAIDDAYGALLAVLDR